MKRKGLISAVSIVSGLFMGGFGFTTTLGSPISTICYLIGMGLMFFGVLLFIMYVRGV